MSRDKEIIAQLSEKVTEYESSLPLPEKDYELWQKTREDLEDKIMERSRGIIFRSRVKWYEEGEKNTKYFFSLEKARYNAKTCYKLIDEEQKEYEQPEDILRIQESFYRNLYQEDSEVDFTMENQFGIKVPDEIKEQQNTQISLKELQEAAKEMNNNKTPGRDGIPVDFYKVFWNQLKEPFHAMVEYSYNRKALHDSAREGILNLIPKPNKDSRYIKNLRPITLLNTDYKIIEKAIANKMIPALKSIINKDQRGFMKDRRISVNIRKMLDIMQHTQEKDLEAVILSLDFVKCFDKCSFKILHGSLEFFGFGERVKEWTKILYKDFVVCIQNNGHFSQAIPINKGVHQGGCCSAIYLLVIAEILALSLRTKENIEGITIKEIRHLLNQFADDMDIASICSEESIKSILEELDKFKYQSGFTVSYEKTTMYRIGSLRHSNASLYDIDSVKWSNEDINVLGVTVAHEDIVRKNYWPTIQKVKEVLNAWYNRGLSLMGKIQVVNTLVASLFVYKMMVLPEIPSYIVKTIDNLIREFLWNGKKSKIAYNILQNQKKDGGLQLVNIKLKDKALKATWPKILHDEKEYASIVYSGMRCSELQEDLWRCSINPKDVGRMRIKSQFWEDTLTSWSEYNYYRNVRIENQIIWYNSKIKINQKLVMWRDVWSKGLKYVHQLFYNQEFISGPRAKELFGLTTLRYNSLKVALPREWVEYFRQYSRSQYCPIPPTQL